MYIWLLNLETRHWKMTTLLTGCLSSSFTEGFYWQAHGEHNCWTLTKEPKVSFCYFFLFSQMVSHADILHWWLHSATAKQTLFSDRRREDCVISIPWVVDCVDASGSWRMVIVSERDRVNEGESVREQEEGVKEEFKRQKIKETETWKRQWNRASETERERK